MDILEKIVQYKRSEVAERRKVKSMSFLEQEELFDRKCISAKQRILSAEPYGIISEFKRQSPSKGIINDKVDVVDVTSGYESAGASAISILTDESFFGGTTEDLGRARAVLNCPILRKDFIVDEYQVIETKAMGADLMLLISACLNKSEVIKLATLAHSVGLEVLLEIHSLEEYDDQFLGSIDLLGVNNRNLKTFETTIQTSINLAKHLPDDVVKISESGLRTVKDLDEVSHAGYQGFLIGEQFMRHNDPAEELRQFMSADSVSK